MQTPASRLTLLSLYLYLATAHWLEWMFWKEWNYLKNIN